MTIKELSALRPAIRVLVTGGAGSVGLEVLAELHRHKSWYRVKVLEQNKRLVMGKLRPYSRDFEIIRGDITNPEVLTRAATDIDVVIHLAAMIPPKADRNPEQAEQVNIEGTRRLVTHVEKLSPGAFFLYASSISVYGDRVMSPWITVDDPLLPSEGDEYARTKISAERIVRGSRLSWSIFRLSAIMGKETRLDPLFFHMPLDTSLEIATSRDAGFAMVEAIHHREALRNRIFNLSGGESCRSGYREFLAKAFEAKGLKKLRLPDEAFAQRNFHCGNYSDSDVLNEILHFQQDSLDDYFNMIRKPDNRLSRAANTLALPFIKQYLLSRSEPLKATKTKQKQVYMRFFYNPAPET